MSGKITIHQAICGEKNKSWDLLKTTLTNRELAKNMALKTDIQDTAGGYKWDPSVRGFAYADYYLIMRSFLDTGEVRPGRAFSHVLIIALSDLDKIPDLGVLFSLLPEKIDKEQPLVPLELSLKAGEPIIDIEDYSNAFAGRFKKLLNGYFNMASHKNTIVWIGYSDYEKAVAEFWKRITIQEKHNFEFGIYFNPAAVPVGKLCLINIPEKSMPKFQNFGWLNIDVNDNVELTDIAQKLLLGDKDAHHSVSHFAREIGTAGFDRSEWKSMAIALRSFESFDTLYDFKKLKTFSHLVAKFSPSQLKGKEFKDKLVKRLAKVMETVSAAELKLFQDLDIKSFQGAEKEWSAAMKLWLNKNLFADKKETKPAMALFEELCSPKNRSWWKKALVSSIEDFFAIANFNAAVFYNWILADESVFKLTRPFIDIKSEEQFISRLPKKRSIAINAALKALARENSWSLFHAKLLTEAVSVPDALIEQLSFDSSLNRSAGVTFLANQLSPEELVTLASAQNHPFLISLAGKACRTKPALLNRLDLSLASSQAIWLEAIKLGNRLSDGFAKFHLTVNVILDLLVASKTISSALIRLIAESDHANLSDYQKMSQLWPKLDPTNRTLFLKATSSAFLEGLSKGKAVNVTKDAVLSKYIFENAISDFLYYNRNNIKPVIAVMKKLPAIPNAYLLGYLRNFRGKLDAGEAKALGKLIQDRHDKESTLLVYQRSERNNSWSVALKECYDLLPVFEKGKIFLSGLLPKIRLSGTEWWGNLHEVISNYYSNPHTLVRLWERAGGHESDLVLSLSAKDIWAQALEKLRRGQFKKITMNSLLKEINKEYGDQNGFKFLYELRKKHL